MTEKKGSPAEEQADAEWREALDSVIAELSGDTLAEIQSKAVTLDELGRRINERLAEVRARRKSADG